MWSFIHSLMELFKDIEQKDRQTDIPVQTKNIILYNEVVGDKTTSVMVYSGSSNAMETHYYIS